MKPLGMHQLDPKDVPDGNYSLTVAGGKVTGLTPSTSGGGSLSVQDENGSAITGVTRLDFQGAGVTATAGTGEVVVTIPGGTGGSGGVSLLGSKSHNPTTDVTYSTTSTTMVDIDATNLVVSFTAPTSGAVVVTLSGLMSMNAAGSIYYWGLRDATGLVSDSTCEMYYNTSLPYRLSARSKITGLTAGNSYTWKWAWMRALGTATLSLSAGKQNSTSFGPALMTVEAA